MKRANISSYYTNLTARLKKTNPRNYFQVMTMLNGGQCDWDIDELRDASYANLLHLNSAGRY